MYYEEHLFSFGLNYQKSNKLKGFRRNALQY